MIIIMVIALIVKAIKTFIKKVKKSLNYFNNRI